MKHINFRKTTFNQTTQLQSWLIISSSILMIIMLGIAMRIFHRVQQLRTARQLHQTITQEQQNTVRLQQKCKQLVEQRTALAYKTPKHVSTRNPMSLLATIADIMPAQVALQQFKLVDKHHIELAGTTRNVRSLHRFIKQLSRLFDTVALEENIKKSAHECAFIIKLLL